MKNLYEILEVDKNASNEIIKVAHKSLVKKYHPDLKEGQEKNNAEQKIKEINDAYGILSDPLKRAEYDLSLPNSFISPEQYNLVVEENNKLKMQLNYLNNKYNTNYSYPYQQNTYNNTKYENTKSNINNAYSINNKKGLKKFIQNIDNSIKNILAIFLTFLFIFILLQIPFFKNLLGDLSNKGFLFVIVAIICFFYFFRNKE